MKKITVTGYPVSSVILHLINPLIWFGHAADDAALFRPTVLDPKFIEANNNENWLLFGNLHAGNIGVGC
jgi:hypothetical protein